MEVGLPVETDTSFPPKLLDAEQDHAGVRTQVRWVVCALLFFATVINYVDRSILALLKETLDKELGWSNAEFGLANSFFQIAYGLSFLWFGWFIDRYGTKIGYATSIALWSLAAAGHSFVHSVNGFFMARLGLGFGEAGNFPSAIKATAQWFPKRERAFATAIFNSGASVATVIAPLTIPVLAAHFGWRSTFVVAGAAGFVWLVAWWALYEVPERHRRVNDAELAHIRSDRDEAQQDRKVPWLSILSYRQAWSFVVAKFLTDPVWWFFLTWLPDYFKKTRGLNISKSMFHLATIYAIITVLSIFGGWLPGHLIKRGWTVTSARKTAMFIYACCALPVFFVTWPDNIWISVILIGLAGAAHQSWSANLFTTVSDMFPKRAVASLTGIGGVAGSAGGFIFPWFTGKLLDAFEKNGNAKGGYAILFGICGFAYLVAFLFHHLLAPRFEQIPVRETTAPQGFDVVPPR
jgi:ACS family hexuronate transporter-like MFS transporter